MNNNRGEITIKSSGSSLDEDAIEVIQSLYFDIVGTIDRKVPVDMRHNAVKRLCVALITLSGFIEDEGRDD